MHLTNTLLSPSDSLASDAKAEDAGAPDDEIEITGEMIERGKSILFEYDPMFSNEADIVIRSLKCSNILTVMHHELAALKTLLMIENDAAKPSHKKIRLLVCKV
jgi:hypothetical protein